MKTISFQYTKENGEQSNRVFVPLSIPNENYFGVDITSLDIEDQVAFDEAMDLINEERLAKVRDLMVKFDVKHNFRTFKPSRMTDVLWDE